MAESPFDVIPFEDIKGNWKKLGAGSFGNVYKGNYLGIDVAIKEVLPSTEYDVSKYFEREWRLMKECRHPNVVLYLGLSRAPDGRIFIISEYIENGNLRHYIYDKNKPFPWRLRLSFATDIVRALAYLHARKCLHRDLKGENLLLTSNLRVKITDFGFARIAARNDSELKRLTFCGTDAYMSPEILAGTPFDLPTDIYSLGVILAEIAARHLADDTHFARRPPSFSIDPDEVRKSVSPGCPEEFLGVILDCLKENPHDRPLVTEILEKLRIVELEVAKRAETEEEGHVGSVKFVSRGRKGPTRPGAAPRIPSFGMGVGKGWWKDGGSTLATGQEETVKEEPKDDEDLSSDEELAQAVLQLNSVDLGENVWNDSTQPLINHTDQPSYSSIAGPVSNIPSDYSTTVIKSKTPSSAASSSILTVRPANVNQNGTVEPTDSMITIDSYHTATTSSAVSWAAATEGGSTIRASPPVPASPSPPSPPPPTPATPAQAPTAEPATPTYPPPPTRPVPPAPETAPSTIAPLIHRFTLIKPGVKSPTRTRASSPSRSTSPSRPMSNVNANVNVPAQISSGGWSPFHLFFASGLLVARCDLCGQRLGWKTVLECDDCGMRTHLKCGDNAPLDCGLRQVNHRH